MQWQLLLWAEPVEEDPKGQHAIPDFAGCGSFAALVKSAEPPVKTEGRVAGWVVEGG